ncbi:hypothetical protein [Litorivivens sp.]|uniref:hypothetical protein n=1 Tax=Litorivivens sp. TaxID=2020868 RepID=UPI0035634A18
MPLNRLVRFVSPFFFAACLLLALPAAAGDLVGTITALPGGDTVEIDNRGYRMSANALIGKAPDNKSSLKLKHLVVGQSVHIITSGTRVTTLRVLHQPDEIPD